MKSLLLISVAVFLIPLFAARDKNPRRGIKRMVLLLLYIACLT